MLLSDSPYKRSNNLQFLRFLAALCVILSHSFAINGLFKSEFFDRYTNEQLSLGGLCVSVFFTCGGYLIAKSFVRHNTFKRYFKARIIRIFPPLIFTVVMCILLGVFFTSVPIKDYFSSSVTYKYLLNGLLIPIHNLPGVFMGNPYAPSPNGSTVNGALWTLPVEFLCYVLLYILGKCGLMDKKKFLFTLPLPVFALIIKGFLPKLIAAMVRPCILFYIGCAFFIYEDKIKLKTVPAVISFSGLCLTFFLKIPNIGIYLFLPYLLFFVSFGIKQLPCRLGKTGNLSYSIYLWGFPVQQALVYKLGTMNPYLNFLLASVIAILLAFITYFITEKPFNAKSKSKSSSTDKPQKA